MNKGLKIHLYSTLIYLIVAFLAIFKINNTTDETRYVLALGYFLTQIAIGIICYLDDVYKEK